MGIITSSIVAALMLIGRVRAAVVMVVGVIVTGIHVLVIMIQNNVVLVLYFHGHK